jgi:hypothetical protein
MAHADDADHQLNEIEAVEQAVNRRLELVQSAYAQIFTTLWAGNGAASLACLSFIGVAPKNGSFPHLFLWPLWFFVLGLISMGVGTIMWLVRQREMIRPMETSTSLLDIAINSVQRPSEEKGLSLRDWRTRGAVVAAACFILGCLFGLVELTWLN